MDPRRTNLNHSLNNERGAVEVFWSENTGRPSGHGVSTAVGTSEADHVMSESSVGIREGFQTRILKGTASASNKMYPAPIQKLIELFSRFPGIGPRQAGRFAFFLLKENGVLVEELHAALQVASERIGTCEQCFRMMERENAEVNTCGFCRDARRDRDLVAVVEKESDMQSMEKTGAYHGLYHVLGGVISPLDPESPKKIRLRELYERAANIAKNNGRCEVILATNTTTEGDTTALYIERILAPLKEKHPAFTISRLGRGLSLGSELEYADEVTLKNALNNRK